MGAGYHGFKRRLESLASRCYKVSGNFTKASTPVVTGAVIPGMTVTKNGTGDYTINFPALSQPVRLLTVQITPIIAAGTALTSLLKTKTIASGIEVLFFTIGTSPAAVDPDSVDFELTVSDSGLSDLD